MKSILAFWLIASASCAAGLNLAASTNQVAYGVSLPSYPWSMSLMARWTGGSPNGCVFTLRDTPGLRFVVLHGATGLMGLLYDPTSGLYSYSGTSAFPTNVWVNFVYVAASGTSRTLYIDGTAVSISGENFGSAVTMNQAILGGYIQGSSSLAWPYQLADFALWTNSLTQTDAASLASGASPIVVRPSSLYHYDCLVFASTNEPVVLGIPRTVYGSPLQTDHPRIYRP